MRELEGVAEQILEHLAQALGVGRDDRRQAEGRSLTSELPELQEDPSAEPGGPGLAERYRVRQKAGGVVAPLLTLLLAFVISGVVVLATTGSLTDTAKTYRAIFRGAGLNWFFKVGNNSIGLPFSHARVSSSPHAASTSWNVFASSQSQR